MEKKGSGKKLDVFLAGKGFYIVLFLCAAIIGISAWSLASGRTVKEAANNDTKLEDSGAVSGDYGNTDSEPAAPVINEDAEPAATETPEDPPATAQTGTFKQGQVWSEAAAVYKSPLEGEIQRAYSMDKLQYDKTMADWRTHDGIDIACQKGAAVKAAHAGTVKSIARDDIYGTAVTVDQSGGMTAVYANLMATPAVKTGQQVSAGDIIGYVGDTAIGESAQAAHLHFSMAQDGKSVDPCEYIP